MCGSVAAGRWSLFVATMLGDQECSTQHPPLHCFLLLNKITITTLTGWIPCSVGNFFYAKNIICSNSLPKYTEQIYLFCLKYFSLNNFSFTTIIYYIRYRYTSFDIKILSTRSFLISLSFYYYHLRDRYHTIVAMFMLQVPSIPYSPPPYY